LKTRTKIIVTVVMTVVLLLVAAPAWAQPIDLELVGESAGWYWCRHRESCLI